MVQLKLLEKLSSAWVQWRLQQKINKQMVQKKASSDVQQFCVECTQIKCKFHWKLKAVQPFHKIQNKCWCV